MPIYNRSSSGTGGATSQEEGGGGPRELAELQAKRTRGNVTADNVFGTVGQLDSNPPPKARPRAHESHEERARDGDRRVRSGVRAFAVRAIDYEDLRAPYARRGPRATCVALYLVSDEDAYDVAARHRTRC